MNRINALGVSAAVVLVAAVVVLPLVVEPARPLLLMASCLLLPGAGWAYRAGVGDAVDRVALALAISMAATILVATGMIVVGAWSIVGGTAALAVVGALGFVPWSRFRRGAR